MKDVNNLKRLMQRHIIEIKAKTTIVPTNQSIIYICVSVKYGDKSVSEFVVQVLNLTIEFQITGSTEKCFIRFMIIN